MLAELVYVKLSFNSSTNYPRCFFVSESNTSFSTVPEGFRSGQQTQCALWFEWTDQSAASPDGSSCPSVTLVQSARGPVVCLAFWIEFSQADTFSGRVWSAGVSCQQTTAATFRQFGLFSRLNGNMHRYQTWDITERCYRFFEECFGPKRNSPKFFIVLLTY